VALLPGGIGPSERSMVWPAVTRSLAVTRRAVPSSSPRLR
jgi:hypothetical protein